ncbi:hypothetical protein ABG768_009404 [Culter alburnus]|uniref:non-specific serine/threonine protein kinase n=1 Tax=Culter alburnus TaxID=194366 RepID=A0AAW1ZD41_CULAL
MSPTPVPERVEKKKRGRLFRWCFSRKSKKTPIEAQQGRCRNCRNQKPQRCSDGEDEQKNNTQSINTPSKNNIVHSLDKAEESSDTNSSAFSHVSSFSGVRVVKVDVHRAEDSSATTLHSHVSSFSAEEKVNTDEAEENSNTSVYSCVSSFSAVEKVNVDLPKAEENSNTSVYSWHSCVSTLNTVQEVDALRPEQEETNMNNSNSPTVSSNVNTSTSPTASSNVNTSTSPTVSSNVNTSTSPTVSSNVNTSTSPTVSSSTNGDLSAPLLSDDNFWKTEDEIINLSSNAKRGDINEDYNIGRLLGQGGFGKVYEGIRLSDSRKSLFGKLLPNEVAMMIRVSEGPSVPQIIKLLDWYETRTDYILVIERPTPCKNLRQYLVKNGGRISESKARVVMHQVVTAARICFERGIFHSDIKLENLLINENSLQVKLIDFGVSRSFKTFGYTRYFGTKLYAPPEAFRRIRRYHAKPATVYSLGVLLFAMLFGKYPYKVKPEVIADILRKAGISKESKELISLCMETDPTMRIDMDKILDHDWFQVLLLKPDSQNEEPIVSEFPCVDSCVLRKRKLCADSCNLRYI